jgi:hypothetical protein
MRPDHAGSKRAKRAGSKSFPPVQFDQRRVRLITASPAYGQAL